MSERQKDRALFCETVDPVIYARQHARTDSEARSAGSLANYLELAASCGMLVTGEESYCPAYRQYNVEDLLLDPLEISPAWVEIKTGKGGTFAGFVIREPELCRKIKKKYFLHCVGGQFFDDQGPLPDEVVKDYILKSVSPFLNENISRRVNTIADLLKIICLVKAGKPPENKIFLADGITMTINAAGEIEEVLEDHGAFTLNRLNVKYDAEATCIRWYKFINELLYPEDITTLQEFMGYCLIPSTKAQAGLFIVGNGGEGKSRISALLSDMFGRSAYSGSLHKLEDNRFEAANLENRLLFIDDDLKGAAFEDTDNFKRIVTADVRLSVERKGKDAREIDSYARIFGCGNEFPSALYDRSDGFYRRQLLLKCKPKAAGRKDDRDLTAALLTEKSGIFNWMLDGLFRLIRNGFEFTRSNRMLEIIQENQLSGDPVAQFMQDADWVIFRDDAKPVMTKVIIQTFKGWCDVNGVPLPGDKSIERSIGRNAEKHGCKKTFHATNGEEHGRGYTGIAFTPYARQNKRVSF